MCTIILLVRAHPEYPVVLAANRDEFYARPAAPPRRLADDPAIVAGVDIPSGGTWLGATARGLFVGLTNQRTYAAADPTLASRGPLVVDALRAGTTAAIDRLLAGLDARAYNSFNLLYGDAAGLRVAYARSDARAVEIHPVPTGAHVLPNDVLDSPEFPKAAACRAAADAARDRPWPALVAALSASLSGHVLPPLDAVPAPPPGSPISRELARELQAQCIHTPAYGTRSSAILALAPGRVAHYLHADGPPCTTSYRDVTPLLS